MTTFGDFNKTWFDPERTPKRVRLARHLHRCGPRPVLEALLEVSKGSTLDSVLESYGRLDPKTCWQLGAADFPKGRPQ